MSKSKKIEKIADELRNKDETIFVSELARRVNSTPFALLKLLATLKYRGRIEWTRVGQRLSFVPACEV